MKRLFCVALALLILLLPGCGNAADAQIVATTLPVYEFTQRLCQGVCVVNSGIIFMEMLTHLERTADQCSNIAMLVLGLTNEAVFRSHHDYIEELHSSTDRNYLAEQEERRRQYLVPLESVQY